MVGDVFDSEIQTYNDPDTGAQVTQFTDARAIHRTLYFTSRPYCSDGQHLIFLSNRSGSGTQLYLLDTRAGRFTQVTDKAGDSQCAHVVHPSQPLAYYHDGVTAYVVNLDTFKSEELFRAPDNFRIGLFNLNAPPWLVFELKENVPEMKQIHPGAGLPVKNEAFYMRPVNLVYRYDIDSHQLHCVWGENKLLQHVQCSPVNPDLLIFSSWRGYGDPRCFYMDMAAGVSSMPRPIFPEGGTARAGHECFTRKGNLYAQWMEGDLRFGREHRLFHCIMDLQGVSTDQSHLGRFTRHPIPERGDSLVHHYTWSYDETWGVHDRWIETPDAEQSLSYLSVIRHLPDEPYFQSLRLCRVNSHPLEEPHRQYGPNLTLTDDDRHATFTKYGDGVAHICQVEVGPLVERLFGGG